MMSSLLMASSIFNSSTFSQLPDVWEPRPSLCMLHAHVWYQVFSEFALAMAVLPLVRGTRCWDGLCRKETMHMFLAVCCIHVSTQSDGKDDIRRGLLSSSRDFRVI